MPKLLIISVNLLALLAYNLFFGGDVTIDQKMPDEVQAGSTFEIEIVIDKGDRDGFAKWQQALPEGFIAESKDTKGGTFSFKNQEVKVIWMSIPKEEEFSIIYTVKVDPEMQGQFDINGKFSFIEDNDRKDVNSAVKQLKVVSEGEAIVEDKAVETEEEVAESMEEVIEEEEPKKSNQENSLDQSMTNSTIAYSDEDVTINRMIKETEPSKYEVTLQINKGDLNSFGKIEEFIPENFVASSMENKDGMFSFRDNVMKILWMTLPSDETIEVKYEMQSMAAEPNSAEITGMFSFLDVDESKQVELGGMTINNTYVPDGASEQMAETIEEEMVEDENDGMLEEAVEEVSDEVNSQIAETIAVVKQDFPSPPAVEQFSLADNEMVQNEEETPSKLEPVEEIEEYKEDEELVAEITNVPAPESDVNYKVQIAAGKREVKQQYFVSRHGITEEVDIEYHEGWFKYTIGGYPIYKEARDRRNEIWDDDNKINDAFVTAYNSGERISVQEALMITKQKWYK